MQQATFTITTRLRSTYSLQVGFAKLSFNFNYNLVESWVSINSILHTHPPTTCRKSLKITWNLNLNPNLNPDLNLNLNPNLNLDLNLNLN